MNIIKVYRFGQDDVEFSVELSRLRRTLDPKHILHRHSTILLDTHNVECTHVLLQRNGVYSWSCMWSACLCIRARLPR